ncbi:MAG: PucR family transcriptional regulator ligand-binding domain-containing protein [Paenibacillaceae bacterium]
MKLVDALKLKSLKRARVVAGALALERNIRWVHVVDVPDPLPWVQAGDFLLTTGYAWPREEATQRALIYDLAERGLSGMGLAVPNFYESMPPAALQAADEMDFPLLEIPWGVPFSSITEEVHKAILTKHYQVLEQFDSMHRELMRATLEAESLQDIAATLGQLIGRVVMIENPEGRVLALYHLADGDKPSNQFMPHQEISSLANIVQLERKGYLNTLRTSVRSIRIPAMPEFGVKARFVCPIHIKRDLIGLLWVVEMEQPLSELDVLTVEYAAIVMALHISQQRALVSLEAQLGNSFLDSLQEGSFVPTSQALRRALLLGFDPEASYRLGMIVLDARVPLSREGVLKRERLAEKLRYRLQELEITTLLSLSQNQISFLLPEQCSAEKIWEYLVETNLSFAIGLLHRGFSGVQQGYAEVRSIVPHLIPGQLHYYEELLVPRVLMGDKDARASFIEKLFGPLKSTKNGDVLVETVLMLARCGFHLKQAAEKLNIHPKTLRYRMDRAITLGGFDLNDSEIQFNLQLAVRLLSFEDNK